MALRHRGRGWRWVSLLSFKLTVRNSSPEPHFTLQHYKQFPWPSVFGASTLGYFGETNEPSQSNLN